MGAHRFMGIDIDAFVSSVIFHAGYKRDGCHQSTEISFELSELFNLSSYLITIFQIMFLYFLKNQKSVIVH